MTEAVVDVRPVGAFEQGHRTGALNIPLEELEGRTHELPPNDARIIVFDEDAARAERGRERLAGRGRWEVRAESGAAWLEGGAVEGGVSRARLWQPHAWLAESLELIEGAWGSLRGRRAIDLACGTGRDAVFLSLRGMNVEAADILPDALERANDLAARYGATLRTRVMDLEKDGLDEREQFDLVIVFNFLHRALFASLRAAVRPSGFVVYETFLVGQRERFGKPARDTHLLQPEPLATQQDEPRSGHKKIGESSQNEPTAGWICHGFGVSPGPFTAPATKPPTRVSASSRPPAPPPPARS